MLYSYTDEVFVGKSLADALLAASGFTQRSRPLVRGRVTLDSRAGLPGGSYAYVCSKHMTVKVHSQPLSSRFWCSVGV